jgi:hypothetical protein
MHLIGIIVLCYLVGTVLIGLPTGIISLRILDNLDTEYFVKQLFFLAFPCCYIEDMDPRYKAPGVKLVRMFSDWPCTEVMRRKARRRYVMLNMVIWPMRLTWNTLFITESSVRWLMNGTVKVGHESKIE